MPLPRKQRPAQADDAWLSSHEAARVAGMSRLALYERALSGEVHTQKVAGRRVFDRNDVERLASRERAVA